jgi:hypothetical protein
VPYGFTKRSANRSLVPRLPAFVAAPGEQFQSRASSLEGRGEGAPTMVTSGARPTASRRSRSSGGAGEERPGLPRGPSRPSARGHPRPDPPRSTGSTGARRGNRSHTARRLGLSLRHDAALCGSVGCGRRARALTGQGGTAPAGSESGTVASDDTWRPRPFVAFPQRCGPRARSSASPPTRRTRWEPESLGQRRTTPLDRPVSREMWGVRWHTCRRTRGTPSRGG